MRDQEHKRQENQRQEYGGGATGSRRATPRNPVKWGSEKRFSTTCASKRANNLLDWLRVEYGIEKPSHKLLALNELDSNTWGQTRKQKH